MHVISRTKLISFWLKHQDSEVALRYWFNKVTKSNWKSINDLKKDFPSADYIGENRIVFNIKGNHYRLIVVIYFGGQKIYIRFVGTHAEYDRINAKII